MSHDETHTHYLPPYYSPAPSSDTGSSDHKEDGPFDPGNTPPLIFAFIAVGFIIFGAIVAVIYKKYRPLPNSRDPHQRSSVPSRRSSIQKPRLWDVWIAPNQPPAFDEERTKPNDWDTFVPLSASLVYPYSPSPSVRVPQQYVQGHVTRPISWENPEHRLFFRHPPADTTLRAAVMISMPKSPQQREPMPSRSYTESEFNVGVTEVKWSG